MGRQSKRKFKVAVVGDATVDWNIVKLPKTHLIGVLWNPEDEVGAVGGRGGAAMLLDIITEMVKQINTGKGTSRRVEMCDTDVLKDGLPEPGAPEFPQSYAIWVPLRQDADDNRNKSKVWRVSEHLGLSGDKSIKANPDMRKKFRECLGGVDLLVIDDAGLGFRQSYVTRHSWERKLKEMKPKKNLWTVLKTSKPGASDALWRVFVKTFGDRLVIVVTADDLRRAGLQISRQLSWEQTVEDAVLQICKSSGLRSLLHCRHLVISFGTAGVLHIERLPKWNYAVRLHYNPWVMEGEWGRRYKGTVIGYTNCLTAAIVGSMALSKRGEESVEEGIACGIEAMRFLQREGYGPADEIAKFGLPLEGLSQVLVQPGQGNDGPESVNLTELVSGLRGVRPGKTMDCSIGYWTILLSEHGNELKDIAHDVVTWGLKQALPDVPVGQFGDLSAVGRLQIESLRGISNLISEYCDRAQSVPISLAVFGPPGSGKSFSVKEVAAAICPGKMKVLKFNLSQLSGPEDLLGAFHQVRDVSLSGKIPLVFWDEFDSHLTDEPLGWLPYFLAPMQDGEFQEGQVTHPIGRSILVFAGSTAETTQEFIEDTVVGRGVGDKTRDFVSRLKGFLDVQGPNPREVGYLDGKPEDLTFVLRRAIMLRSMLRRHAPQIFRDGDDTEKAIIDHAVVHGFLGVEKYKHGARSIEAIICMSRLAGKDGFRRSCLPPADQLDLHVNSKEFLNLVSEDRQAQPTP
jgi:hypothetical protein